MASSGGNRASDNFVQLDSNSLQTILFGFDKYTIQESMLTNIENAANALKQSNAKVVLEGNTDSFGSDEYNFALGKKRADSVRNALEIRGVNPNNISTVTYGESKPVCTQATKECYQANRRVDFKLAQ
ncbi:MAG TPA: OmpA family protein [Candidatus Helicobacter avicola]|nr:OmpA family protein [Candidatus Helicobacter avicola]